MRLYTIGYARTPQAALIARLKQAGVETLADVRALASSRLAGFSKSLLRASLEDQGIAYVHLPGVGTPKAGREAARAGNQPELQRIYGDHMAEPRFQLDYEKLRDVARGSTTALLCYCGQAATCHRHILSDRLAAEDGFQVIDL
jgi:Uncharacterized conserved protein